MAQVDVQCFPDNQTPIEEYFSKSVTPLSRCLEVICRCTNSNCFYRVRGVKYDMVCRLYEHVHKQKISVPPSIAFMKIQGVKDKLKGSGMRFSGTDMDLRERLTWVTSQICIPARAKDSTQFSPVPNVEVLKLSAIVHSVLCL